MPPTTRAAKPADILGALLTLAHAEYEILPDDRTRLHRAICAAQAASPLLTQLGCGAHPHIDHPIVDSAFLQMQHARILHCAQRGGQSVIDLTATRYFDEIVLSKFTRAELSTLRRAAKIFGAILAALPPATPPKE
ncbi:hypothetical protein HY632_04160 [Candidatus Uhrbacteria bacterium]|nr:hypothetical protein [Candidatus Uhrbacteria bacterium]